MAKTYSTIPSVATGDVLTAAAWNTQATNVNNYRVPPMCLVRRVTNITSYTNGAAIAWESAAFDTDSIFSAGSPTRITINTAGMYVVTFTGYATSATAMTQNQAQIQRNGVNAAESSVAVLNGGTQTTWSICALMNLAVSDYLTADIYVSGGSSMTIAGSSTDQNWQQTRLSATWVGQTS